MENHPNHDIFRKIISQDEKNENGWCHCSLMNRRDFLAATGAAIAGLALPLGGMVSCDNPEDPFEIGCPEPPMGKIPVALVRGTCPEEIETMVFTAIEMAGGLSEIKAGDTVVIKPNITAGLIPGMNSRVNTSREVIQAVIRAAKTRTSPDNITVAEASAFNLSTQFWAKEQGIYDVCEAEGVHFMAWEKRSYVAVTSPWFSHIDFNLLIPESLYNGTFDHFINVPFLKNHDMARDKSRFPDAPWEATNVDYTCCIKNHVGCVKPINRLYGDDQRVSNLLILPAMYHGIHQTHLGEICAELNLAVPKHVMNVVDAEKIILAGGPASLDMDLASPSMILASKDRVACDSMAVALLRYYAAEFEKERGHPIHRPYVNKSVWDQAQIRRAQELNLGRTRENIEIVHSAVEDIDAILGKWA